MEGMKGAEAQGEVLISALLVPQHAAHLADAARGRDGSMAPPQSFMQKLTGPKAVFDPHTFLSGLDSDDEDGDDAVLAIYDGMELSDGDDDDEDASFSEDERV